jgi:hypothetical protein
MPCNLYSPPTLPILTRRLPFPVAGPTTAATVGPYPRIRRRELVAVHAVCLPSMLRRWTLPTQRIFAASDRLKVCGTVLVRNGLHAGFIAAKVVGL